jgi:hypothetical protein
MPSHGAGVQCEGCADVMQTDDLDHSAGEQRQGGRWVALRDAATLMGVSVDTVKRRMQRGELQARRETIPQGFRWLVRVDDGGTVDNINGSNLVDNVKEVSGIKDDNINLDSALQIPTPDADVLTFLQGQLEERNREIASLLATVASQARAMEHAEERLRQLEAPGSPESVADGGDGSAVEASTERPPAGLWQRLLDALRRS